MAENSANTTLDQGLVIDISYSSDSSKFAFARSTVSRRDFGSFHSSNVQELLSLTEDLYQPPDIPIDLPKFDADDRGAYGKDIKGKHFLLGDEYTFLNHGAFGSVLKEALDAVQAWQRYTEAQPLKFLDRELFPQLVHVSRRLCNFIGCTPTDIALIENATTGTNAVLKSMKFSSSDTIYYLDCTYGAVKKLLKFISSENGCSLKEIKIPSFVENQQQIIDLVRSTLRLSSTENFVFSVVTFSQECTFAVFDHIPSNFPIIMPIKEIVKVCKERNIPVFIDGAHALGSLPIKLSDIDADFYVSNAHKWFCSAKGCAFLYIKRCWQKKIRSQTVSHGFGSGFNSEFIWTVLDFWSLHNPDSIRKYIYGLVAEASQMLATKWDTKLAASKDMFGSMCLIQLPECISKNLSQDNKVTYEQAEIVQNVLYRDFKIEDILNLAMYV
ncbi:uncharacterized protein TRIADDRAFT_56707 [Trichoplax adhaerens]|uniref:Aminotransferase class V domain-containing protein n=1 Tax=Trichoplax adhaerens TaxID=10228 RepID=B3RWD0_TRIAD|nr:hypothetical protein TRIADDRAFT_56707 [Trichoplax adhaerens]EDV25115.1 hypothetical protein TRIADDRAFT_56707 [Trichoplax adhaerens]|eukprot:XP_002113005.1 hypothetical protein TRIADDRAFT_56707 [Trichoplax adhaerens]